MQKPNLLFIYTDEQAFNTLEAYGNLQINMPNLNRLAKRSVVFDQAYVTQPVCTPSRSSLLTGLYPHSNGCTQNNVPLSSTTPCLPERLSDRDYASAHFGKWHLGNELFCQHGFQKWISIEDEYNQYFSEGKDRSTRSDYHGFLVQNGFTPENGKIFSRGEAARLPEAFGKPAFLAREASRFLREHQDSPFILYVNFLEPHMPFFGPRDNQYNHETIPLPPNFDELADESCPLKSRVFAEAYREWGHSGMPLKTPEDWKGMIARYWGLCSLVDTHIGTILDVMKECGQDDNTIIVFTSDHGDMMGSHRLLAKCVMFEEAVRVPMFIHLPGQRQGRRVHGPVSQIDLVPTLLELLGQPHPSHLHGESLCAHMQQDGPEIARNVFIEWNGPNSGIVGEAVGQFRVPPGFKGKISFEDLESSIRDPVRTLITPEGWKLNFSPRGEHELYYLPDDPGETENVFVSMRNKPIVTRMAEEISQWQKRTGDSVKINPLMS